MRVDEEGGREGLPKLMELSAKEKGRWLETDQK
jgi:hypothetical protein